MSLQTKLKITTDLDYEGAHLGVHIPRGARERTRKQAREREKKREIERKREKEREREMKREERK